MNPVELLKHNYNSENVVERFQVTGVMMQYLPLCERELWLNSRRIPIDKSNEHLMYGDLVDSNSFSESRDEELIGGMIRPDVLEDGKIVEVKPSSNVTTGAKSQLEYYLWVFAEILGDRRDGVISIPPERKREVISYDSSVQERVENRIESIYDIIRDDEPPMLEKKELCETCAYKDFCWVNSYDDKNE